MLVVVVVVAGCLADEDVEGFPAFRKIEGGLVGREWKRQPLDVDRHGHAIRSIPRRNKDELIDEENLDWLGDTVVSKEDLERDSVGEEDDGDDDPVRQRSPAQRKATNLSGTASFKNLR